jgi:hypothetical protein
MYIHLCRGYKAILSQFPEGFKNVIILMGRWAAQLKTLSKEKQLCLKASAQEYTKTHRCVFKQVGSKHAKLLHEIIRTSHMTRIPEKTKGGS